MAMYAGLRNLGRALRRGRAIVGLFSGLRALIKLLLRR